MCRLNYMDLLALVVEYDIESIEENIKMMNKSKNKKEVITASNEDILRMHKRR